MPRKRRYRRRRPRRRYRMRTDFHKHMLAQAFPLVTTGNGRVDFNVHYKTLSRTINGYFGMNNYAKFKDIYDEFRPTYLTLEYIPYLQKNIPNQSTANMPQAVVAYDPDNTNFGNVNDMLAHKHSYTVDLSKKWTRKWRLPKYASNTLGSLGFLNLQMEQADDHQQGIVSMKSLGPSTFGTEVTVGIIRIRIWYLFNGRNDSNVQSYYGVGTDGSVLESNPYAVLEGAPNPNPNDDGLADDDFVRLMIPGPGPTGPQGPTGPTGPGP